MCVSLCSFHKIFNILLGASSVPNDQSLKLYRAEANLGLLRFSDALMDLDYLCCLHPNWTEVSEGQVLDTLGCLLFYFLSLMQNGRTKRKISVFSFVRLKALNLMYLTHCVLIRIFRLFTSGMHHGKQEIAISLWAHFTLKRNFTSTKKVLIQII